VRGKLVVQYYIESPTRRATTTMDISANPADQVAEAEMADIDQFRPAKKSRVAPGSLEGTEQVREEMADEDEDWDDIYGTNAQGGAERESKPSAVEQQIGSAAVLPMTAAPTASGVVAETDQDVDMTAAEGAGALPLAAAGQHQDPEPCRRKQNTNPRSGRAFQPYDSRDIRT
jgi:hypothetical protein